MDTESEMDLLKAKIQSSKASTEPSKRSEMIEYALKMVEGMMGYFKKVEPHDPVRYPLGLAEILSRYPREVINKVTSASGLPSQLDYGIPTLKQVRDACDEELKLYEARRKPKFIYRAPEHRPPSFAPNTFVPEGNPYYQKLVGMSEHPSARHLKLFRFEERVDDNGIITNGIMVPLGWWDEVKSASTVAKTTETYETEEDLIF